MGLSDADREAARELGASAPPLSSDQVRMVRNVLMSVPIGAGS